jgi:hypothetical protein
MRKMISLLLTGVGLAVVAAAPGQSRAADVRTLVSFCTVAGFGCADGADPSGSLIADADGNLFGTTNKVMLPPAPGTVFEIAKTASGYASTPATLVTFCSLPNCADGRGPGDLIADANGNLFGTTGGGGTGNNGGTVFEIVKTADGYASTPTILASFCSLPNCADGAEPNGLVADADGNLFGTIYRGGTYGRGTVFEIVKTADGYASTPTTLVGFCAAGSPNCADGAGPFPGLTADADGNLFGTTTEGGTGNDGGTVFEITGSGFVTPVVLPPSEVTTTASGLAYSRVSDTFNGAVTITNISGSPISGPFSILFTSLTAGVTLANAAGQFSGSSFLTVPSIPNLAAGQSASVSVEFRNPSFGMINFTPVIYSGNL